MAQYFDKGLCPKPDRYQMRRQESLLKLLAALSFFCATGIIIGIYLLNRH